jgi:tetratricopeptide (TPR) repeat protein
MARMGKLIRIAALLLAAGAPAAAQAKWREASSTHFVIYSEESAESLRKFAERLERYDSAIRRVRGLPDRDPGPANRLTVYAVSTVGTVQKIMGRGSSNVAGFYIPRAGGSLAIVPRRGLGGTEYDLSSETVLLHEYSHHFMFENYAAAYPSWFIEGFAEFHSTAKFEADGGVGVGLPALHRAYGIMSHKPLRLSKMLALTTERLSPGEIDSFYGRGWLLTHYLTFEPSRKGQLSAYLKALNSGKTGLAAAEVFGDLDKLERELDTYIRRPKMSYLPIGAQELTVGKIQVRELSAAEDAVMDVKIRSKRGVDEKGAAALLPLARRAAAPYPNDVAAQVTLAEAEFDAGNHKEAEAAADRALAVDPKSVDALIYKGRARLAMALAAGDKGKGVVEARKWFAAANRADPDDPEPHLLFYSSYLAADTKPTANSVVGLNYAFGLAPQDRELRMLVARQYLIDGKAEEARYTLAPIAFDPHAGGVGTAAAAIVAAIDQGGAAAALKKFDEPAADEKKSAG